MQLFDRIYSLSIGKDNTVTTFDALRFSFAVSSDDTKNTNTADLTIYNLSKEHLGLLEEKNTYIIIKVGYSNELSTLFRGDIVEYENSHNAPDTLVKIKARDGYTALSEKKISLSFAENSNTKQIIDKIVSELNFTKSSYLSMPSFVYKQGFSFVGLVGNALDKILSRVKYEWVVINNALIISEPNKSPTTHEAQLLTPQTGLLSMPERFKATKVKTKTADTKLSDGWKFQALIIPSLQPKNLIKVQTNDINAVFMIKSIAFLGDTHGNNWKCNIEAIKK